MAYRKSTCGFGRCRKRSSGFIHGYKGPFSTQALEVAKHELLTVVENMDTIIWRRIRTKTGIYENGERYEGFSGWGQASRNFSHANLNKANVFNITDVQAFDNEMVELHSSDDRTRSSQEESICPPSSVDMYNSGLLINAD